MGAGAGNDVCVFALYIKNTSSCLMHSPVTFGVAGLGLGVQVQVRVQATMYLVTSVPAQHITYVFMLDCVPVADAGVPPRLPPLPSPASW